ncbi:13468_t:CDS:2, partial [Acaulospora colombiana]
DSSSNIRRDRPHSESVMSASTNVDMFRLGQEVAKPFEPWSESFLEAAGQLENQERIKLDLVFEEISEMHKKMKKIVNNNEDELLNAPQIPASELSDPSPKVIRGKIYKQMLRDVVPVACKPVIIPDNSSRDALRIKGQLAILGRLYSSNHIIKFHGVSTINGHKNIVLDWAEHGNLRQVYEEKKLNWHLKLKIAHEICNGLVFLQACGIFHHDIRCENILITGGDKYEAKIANFYLSRDTSQMSHGIPNLSTIVRWLAPEKMPRGNNPIKEPYTFKCELAFERFPYKEKEMPEITEHVLAKKRETLNFSDGPQEIVTGFNNIIVASWNHDPQLRPVIKDLFSDLTMLVNQHGRNSSEIEFVTRTENPQKSKQTLLVHPPVLPPQTAVTFISLAINVD